MFNRKKIKALKKDVERIDLLYRQEKMVSNALRRAIDSQEMDMKVLKGEIAELEKENEALKEKNLYQKILIQTLDNKIAMWNLGIKEEGEDEDEDDR